MENHIQHIDLINSYLNGTLSEKARNNFENRLQTDPDFYTLFEEHNIFLEGLKRLQLKAEIAKAKQSFTTTKWMRFFGASILILTVVAVAYILISKTASDPIQNKNNNINTTVIDTLSKEKQRIDSVKTEKSIVVKDSVPPKKEIVVKKPKPKNNVVIPLKKAAQKFKIDTQKDTTIICEEGTKLSIKANSFVNKNGHLITGTIDLKVTEYYKLSDMLLANLSTTSNGEQLETGGMLFMEASKKDTPLKLKRGIEISFPAKHKKEGMQLFLGAWENDIMNWRLSENEEKTEVENIVVETTEESIEVPFTVIEEAPIYPGCDSGNNAQRKTCMTEAIKKHVQNNFDVGIAASLGFSGRQRVNTIFKIDENGNVFAIQSRASHPSIEAEANRVMALLPKMKPGKQRGRAVTVPYSLPIIFTVSGDSKVFNVSVPENNQIEQDTVYDYVRGKTELIREVMHDSSFKVDSAFIKTWEAAVKQKQIRIFSENSNRKAVLRKSLFETKNTRFKILEGDSISRGGHVIRKLWDESQVPTSTRKMRLVPKEMIYNGREKVTVEEFERRLQDSTNVSITTNDLNNYVLRTSGLGWINCDRFINGRAKRIKYKLKIKNAENASVNMVFKSFNSIIPSRNFNGNLNFGTVIKNEDVTIIAIKKENGKLYLGVVETKTEENQNLKFNFKEVSLKELKDELEKLNKLF